MKDAPKGRIAFLVPHPYVDAVACFREPIRWLAQEGWHIDLYTRLVAGHPWPQSLGPTVRVIPIEMTRSGVIRLVARIIGARPGYQWLFTVPQWGLHYGGMAARLAGIPMVCISDELIAESELQSREQLKWKAREWKAHQRCEFTIALSEERAAFIRQENRLGQHHPIYVVPNSAPGPAQRLTSHYYQDVLGIGGKMRILLHAGSLWYRSALELAEIAGTWNDDWVLVFQGRNLGQVQGRGDDGNVRFTQTLLPSCLLDHAASSAHIGLALYENERVNDRLAGTASGKLALYMKNALPVITTSQKCFEWIETEGCGVCVDNVRDVYAAVEKIWADYDTYVENVKRQYSARLDFARNFLPVGAKLAPDSGRPPGTVPRRETSAASQRLDKAFIRR